MKHLNAIPCSTAAGILLAYLVGCQPQIDDLILAEVGAQKITGAEFGAFIQRVPAALHEGATALAADRNLLESLIDKKLLAQEAQAMDIENDPWFQERMEQEKRAGLLALYRQREIVDQIAVSEDEIQQHYRATGRDRTLRYGILMTATREEARQAHSALKAGAGFGDLARKLSLHLETRERGGDTGIYRTKDQVSPAVAEGVFQLQVGAISAPVPVRYDDRTCFAIFKILDEKPAPLETSASSIREELAARKRAARLKALLDSANGKYSPQIDPEALRRLIQKSQAAGGALSELPAAEGEQPLCTYAGGRITVAEFLQAVRALRVEQRDLADSGRVEYLLRHVVIPQHLFAAEARIMGLDADPQLRAALARKREEWVLMALYRRTASPDTSVSDAEARAFYDIYPERFVSPETIVAVEILAPTDTLARQLREELLNGVDAEQLARQHTVRPGAASHSGRIRLNVHTQVFFPDLYEAAQDLEAGEVGGPVKTASGYSVFKILKRVREKAPYDEESRRLARNYVKLDKTRKGYARYLRELRQKYPVKIYEENLRRLSAARDPSA